MRNVSFPAVLGRTILGIVVFVTSLWGMAVAAPTPDFLLQTGRWEQLVIPADSSEITLRSMFADDLPAQSYGSNWVVFRFDAQSGEYVDPGLDGMIAQGAAFWMIQLTGTTVTLDLPESISLARTINDSACAGDSCSEVPVYSQSGQSTFNMLGTALTTNSLMAQTRLRTTGGSSLCQNGCDIGTATSNDYLLSRLWHYNSSSEQYDDLVALGQIAPWQGFWLLAGSGLSSAAADILFPTASRGNDPGAPEAARLLAQATFGPSLESIEDVRQLGIEAWVDDQFTRKGDSYLRWSQTYFPNGGSLSGPRQNKWLLDAIDAEDQLRLRVAFAYSEIFVTSDLAENLKAVQWGMANYYDILRDYAFGNYRDLIEAVTLSPIMGIYLSMLQNAQGDPDSNTRADENFAREAMQLFSIGLHELNLDGTTKNDSNGNPIPAYNQADVEEYARVYTGWDYNNVNSWGRIVLDGQADKINPMTPFPGYHDSGSKNLLGGVVSPAGISAEDDLDIALDSLFNHPNVGPFIGRQLIQRLVTSNPTPGYVARVASAFNNNGEGVRGDMRAVIRAILLDSEARTGYQNVPNFGKLREPLLRWTHLWRAMNVIPGTESQFGQYNTSSPYITGARDFMGQSALSAPSVFNFFSPDFSPIGALREANLVVPEAEIYTQAYFLTNTRKISSLIQNFNTSGNDNTLRNSHIDITSETAMAVSSNVLLEHLNLVLLSGQMTQGLRQILLDHLNSLPSDEAGRAQRVLDAVILIMASPQYLVQQ